MNTESIVSDVSTDQDAGTTDAENLNKIHEDCTAVTEQSYGRLRSSGRRSKASPVYPRKTILRMN